MVKWSEIDPQIIADYCNQFHERYGEYPSLRDIFYRFVDELWANTKAVYKSLSRWLVTQRLNKKIDWKIIRDGAGREYDEGDWTYSTPREHVRTFLNLFTEAGSCYNLPKWLNQPKLVAVVSEKEADYPVIKSITSGLNVDTAYARGYSGWRMLFELAEKVKQIQKQLVIIALADFDPSGGEGAKKGGKDLVSFLLRAMTVLGVENVIVEKVAVTEEQIDRFKLPHRPEDAKEIEKLQKDPRFKTWRHGLYRVETVALRNKEPDYFDQLIRDAVNKHFDSTIYEKIAAIEKEAREKVEEFFEDQSDLIDEFRSRIQEDERLE